MRSRAAFGPGVAIVILAAILLTGCGKSDSPGDEASNQSTSPTSATPDSSVESTQVENPAAAAAPKKQKQKKKAPLPEGPVYHIKIDGTEIETEQTVGKVYRLKLGWYNFGDNRLPNLAVTFSTTRGYITAGERDGRSPRPAFETAAGPAWKLLPGYPRLAGTSKLAGTTSDGKTFTLGPLEPREKKLTIWKLKAVAPGKFSLKHEAAGDLSDESLTKSPYRGLVPGSWYQIEISPGRSGA